MNPIYHTNSGSRFTKFPARGLRLLAMALVLAASLQAGLAQELLLGWETADIPDPKQASLSAATVAGSLEASLLTRGAGLGVQGTAAANTFFATDWNVADLAGAIAGNKYFQVTVQASDISSVSLYAIRWNFRRSSTGPNAMQWHYSTNGTDFTAIGDVISYTGTESNGLAFGPVELSEIPALQDVPSSTIITLRLYGWGASAAGGSGSIGRLAGDDIIITGEIYTPSVDLPGSFTATGTATSVIALGWALNAADKPVVLAYNTINAFAEPSGTYSPGHFINGVDASQGTVLYVGGGTSFEHTGLDINTTYYYSIWSLDDDLYSLPSSAAGKTLKPEPSGHASSLLASAALPDYGQIVLSWTDAAGDFPPEAYLVKGSDADNVANPSDGVSEADGPLVKNVLQGIQTATFNNLVPATTYYFKIFPYANTGAQINYKTDGPVPQVSKTTASLADGYFVAFEQEGESKPVYGAGTLSLGGISWNLIEVMTGDEASDFRIGNRSLRLRGYGTSEAAMLEDKMNGLGVLQFYYRRYGTDTQVAWVAEYSQNEGESWTQIGDPFTAPANNQVSKFTQTVNLTGSIRVRIRTQASTGTSNRRLNIDDILLSDYLQVTTANTDGNWTDAVWSHGAPSAGSTVVIDSDVVINTPVSAYGLSINPGHSLVIEPTGSLSLSGPVQNQAGGSGILLQSNALGSGSIILKSEGVTGTVERYVPSGEWTGPASRWHFLSSPVSGQPIAGFTAPATGDRDFYVYHEPAMTWVNQKNTTSAPTWASVHPSSNFVLGKGYLVSYEDTWKPEFEGEFNVSDLTLSGFTLTGAAGPATGWHLVGNPFASAIDLTHEDWAWGGFSPASVKVWEANNGSYTDIATTGGNIIPAMQGFLVQTNTDNTSLTIPAKARVHHDQNWYKRNRQHQALVFTVKEYGGSRLQRTNILLLDRAGESFDFYRDSRFMATYAPQLFVYKGQERLSSAWLPDFDRGRTISMGFVKNHGYDAFVLELDTTLLHDQLDVFLHDLVSGTVVRISETPVYAFTASASDPEQRFRILFDDPTGTGPELAPDAAARIFASGQTVYVQLSGHVQGGDMTVYDLGGRVLLTRKLAIEGLHSVEVNHKPGIYVVRVNTPMGTAVQRVAIW